MIRDHLFVIAAREHWDSDRPGPIQRLAAAIAVQNSVLWVNPPYDPETLVAMRREGIPRRDVCEQVLDRLSPSLWVLEPPIMLPTLSGVRTPGVFDRFNAMGNESYALLIRWAVAHIGGGNFFLLTDNNPLRAVGLPALLRPMASLYWLCAGPPWPAPLHAHAARNFPRALRDMDVVLASTAVAAQRARRHNPDTFEIDPPAGQDPQGWSACADRLYTAILLVCNPEVCEEPVAGGYVS